MLNIDLADLSSVHGGGTTTTTTTDTDTGSQYGGFRIGTRTHQTRTVNESDYATCVHAAVATHRDIASCGLPPGSQPVPAQPTQPSHPAAHARPAKR